MGYNKAQYQKNQGLIASNTDLPPTPGLKKVKTDGRIGSVTHHALGSGGLDVKNNPEHSQGGSLGSKAASHMSAGPNKGPTWNPRVAKARAVVDRAQGKKGFRNPINVDTPPLKPIKPD